MGFLVPERKDTTSIGLSALSSAAERSVDNGEAGGSNPSGRRFGSHNGQGLGTESPSGVERGG